MLWLFECSGAEASSPSGQAISFEALPPFETKDIAHKVFALLWVVMYAVLYILPFPCYPEPHSLQNLSCYYNLFLHLWNEYGISACTRPCPPVDVV